MGESGEHNVSDTRDIILHNYLHLMSFIILYWDHIITFSSETRYLWRRKSTKSSWIFLFNRYLAFFGNIPVFVMDFVTLPHDGCSKYILYRQLLLMVNAFFIGCLMALRVYALYECNRRIRVLLIVLSIATISAACWSMMEQKHFMSPAYIGGCHAALSYESSIRLVVAWVALFGFDTILFGLMMVNTYWASNKKADEGMAHVPLLTLIVRDGTVYFGVMAIANLANILTFYLAGPFLRGSLSTLASSISLCMICRLMLNLHIWADKSEFGTTRDAALDSIAFYNEELASSSCHSDYYGAQAV